MVTLTRAAALAVASVLLLPAGAASAADDGRAQVVGEVQRLAVEMHDGSTVDLTVVVPEVGDAVRVQTRDLTEVETGAVAKVTVEGTPEQAQAVDDPVGGLEVLATEVLEEAPGTATDEVTAGSAPALGELAAAATVGVRPVHLVTGTLLGQTTTTPSLADLTRDVDTDVRGYWSDSTGGRLTFATSSTTAAGVYRDWGSTGTCSTSQILAILDWSAAAAGFTDGADGTQEHTVLHTPDVAACGFAGVAHVDDGGSAWINGVTQNPDRWVTVAHELGHTVGLEHSNSRVECTADGRRVPDAPAGSCRAGAYGDAYDVMGTSLGGPGPLSGAQLDALGLLTSTSAATGPTTTTLAPVGSLTGRRFLRVPSGGRTYYLEYRARVGRDGDLGLEPGSGRIGCPLGVDRCTSPTVYQPGVVVRVVETSGSAATHLLDARLADAASGSSRPWFVLPVGHELVTADGAYGITVTSTTSSGARVTVRDTSVATGPRFDQVVASPDVTGDRISDVLAVDGAGQLYLYPGNGRGTLRTPRSVGSGWGAVRLYAPGDWDGDRRADVVTVDASGRLFLHRGNGQGGFAARTKIGWGWTGFRIVPAGDINGDRAVDLLAIDSGNRLWLYPGDGSGGFSRRVQVGNGWRGFELYAAGDMNRDGRADIVSIDTAGRLWFYAGRGGGYFHMRTQAGYGWKGFAFASGGDFNADGLNDLIGRDPEGRLWFYAGRVGGTFAMRSLIGEGW